MKQALTDLLRTEPRLCPAFLLDPSRQIVERLEAYAVANLPTLILYRNGIERTRWSGFFETPADEAREQMRDLLLRALHGGAGS